MTQPQHDDPFGEARQQILQSLAVAATVGEAAARWAAVGIQQRATNTQRQTAVDAATAAADQVAHDTQQQQDRHLIDHGLTDWLSHASMADTVRLWRTATIHAAAGDTRASQAATLAQQRLRLINQPLMDAYDRHRGAGMGQAEAMKVAAYDMWTAQTHTHGQSPAGARPHGTREAEQLPGGANGRSLDPGGTALDDLDAAVRAEAGRLAAHINPEALDRLQRQWRAAGMTPAADAARLLTQVAQAAAASGAMPRVAADGLAASLTARAETERRAAELDTAQPDNPATPAMNEHHDGQNRARVHTDLADADLAAAADRQRTLMNQTFPPLTTVAKTPGHNAAKQPATNAPTPRRPRTR